MATTIEHRNIRDPEIHEPKGIENAVDSTLYVADGYGSGDWKKVSVDSLQGLMDLGIANRYLVTNGSGGFSFADTTAYAFLRNGSLVTSNGFTFSGGVLRPIQSGVYLAICTVSTNAGRDEYGDPVSFTAGMTMGGTLYEQRGAGLASVTALGIAYLNPAQSIIPTAAGSTAGGSWEYPVSLVVISVG